MSNRYEFGLSADERQRLDHYKAAYKAFMIMSLLGMLGMVITFLVLQNDVAAAFLAVITLTGFSIYAYHLRKTGWVEYVQEGGNGRARGSGWKSIVFGSIPLAGFWLLYLHILDNQPLVPSIFPSIVYGVSVASISVLAERLIISRKKR